MRARRVMFLVSLPVLLVFTAASALSQSYSQRCLFDVMIPFEFAVGDTVLPAGHYCVSHVSSPYVVEFSNLDGKGSALVLVQMAVRDQGQTFSKLVFNKYGDKYFLSQVWTAADSQIHRASISSSERQLMASEKRGEQVFVLAMKR